MSHDSPENDCNDSDDTDSRDTDCNEWFSWICLQIICIYSPENDVIDSTEDNSKDSPKLNGINNYCNKLIQWFSLKNYFKNYFDDSRNYNDSPEIGCITSCLVRDAKKCLSH